MLIVVLQSLPNIAWALLPSTPNALEGNASSVPVIEYGEHILGVAIMIMLLFLVNKTQTQKIPRNSFAIIGFAAIILYWLYWALYFAGVQSNPVVYAMVILPPIVFFSANVAKKVWPISASSSMFLIFHLLVTLENFPIL